VRWSGSLLKLHRFDKFSPIHTNPCSPLASNWANASRTCYPIGPPCFSIRRFDRRFRKTASEGSPARQPIFKIRVGSIICTGISCSAEFPRPTSSLATTLSLTALGAGYRSIGSSPATIFAYTLNRGNIFSAFPRSICCSSS
jgi:hypothetical protein